MKQKYINAYMDVAHRFAQLSSAKRLQVGAIIVKDDRIISIGYNGMPAGWTNDCEYRDYKSPYEHEFREEDGTSYNLKTKPEVIHAEDYRDSHGIEFLKQCNIEIEISPGEIS